MGFFIKMILLNKNTANTIALTLTEKVTIENPLFLIQFENKQSDVTTNIMVADTSIYKDRYNKFIITEKVTPDPLLGELTLSEGDYIYYAYQVPTATTTAPSTGLVEKGICKVIGVAKTEYTNEDNDTDIVHNG